MLDLDKLSKLRFGMSEVPKIGGQPGIYEEKWSQWFLERSFFRDFVYRNPRGKKKGKNSQTPSFCSTTCFSWCR